MSYLRTITRTAIAAAASALVAGCATTMDSVEYDRELISPETRAALDIRGQLRSPIYIRSYTKEVEDRTQPIRLSEPIPLYQVVEASIPGYDLVPTDAAVNLNLPVQINVGETTVSNLLKTLQSQTGYDYRVVGRNIEVSAFLTREWTIPMYTENAESSAEVSGATSGNSGGGQGGGAGGGGGGGSQSGSGSSRELGVKVINKDDDQFKKIVEDVERIIGADEGAAPLASVDATGASTLVGAGRAATEPRVVSNRQVGLVRAYGPAARIHEADRYMQSLIKYATKQIRLDVRSIELSMSDSKAVGVNWNTAINTIFNDALGSAGISLGADFSVQGQAGDGIFSVGAQAQQADDSVNAIVDFLSSYGNVELRNEPQVTVFNGRTAYIGSGEEFGYIASVEQTVSNGTVVATPQIQRILIGVELSITARVDDLNRVVMTVVPVISTFRGFDNFQIADSQFSQPRIILNQLKTEVITVSGRPVHLGGLMSSRLDEAVRDLPLQQGTIIKKMLSPLFEGREGNAERRELMLVVTPYVSSV